MTKVVCCLSSTSRNGLCEFDSHATTMKVICKICKADRTASMNQIFINEWIKSGKKYYNSKGELETYKEIKKCKCNK